MSSEEILLYVTDPQMVRQVVESNSGLLVVIRVNPYTTTGHSALHQFSQLSTEYTPHGGYLKFIVLYDRMVQMPLIFIYRNHYCLNGESCVFDLTLIRWKLEDLLKVQILRGDVLQSDIDAILNACGRKPFSPGVSALRHAVNSPTYNGNIDSYRQPSRESREVGLELVPLSSPLHFAARARLQNGSENIEVVMHLVLIHNADMNAQNAKGETVLHHALLSQNSDILMSLVDWGADIVFITDENTLQMFGFMIQHTGHIQGCFRFLLQLLTFHKYSREQCEHLLRQSRFGGHELLICTILNFTMRKPLTRNEKKQINALPPSIVAEHRALLTL